MRTALGLLAILLCPLAVSTSGELRLEFDLPADSFLALRFRVANDTDLDHRVVAYTCPDPDGTSAQAFGHRLILDGALSFGSFGPGGTGSPTPDRRLVEVGAQGNSHHTPDPWDDPPIPPEIAPSGGGCWRSSYGIGPWLRSGAEATDVHWTTSPRKVFANVTWTRGFLGYDVAQGPIGAFKPHDFEQGVAVGVTPWLLAGASAGAILSQTVTTQHDSIGDWWPYVGDHPGGDSFCYQDGVACPPFAHDYFFQSEGPTTWQWGFNLRPELSTPHYPLIVIELPDDSYLYD